MKVAVVQNQKHNGVICRFGVPCKETYGQKTVQAVVAALREGGHEVLLCGGDKSLLGTLEEFMPAGLDGRPTGMVFNMAYGIQGECRYTHVPAMLEMAGIPYTGSSPLGHALALDKVVTKDLIRAAGIPTPNYRVMDGTEAGCEDLRFPVIVKPRHESTSFGLRLVHDPRELPEAVRTVAGEFGQTALVEEYVEGREVCVALLGNGQPELLPIVEQDFGDRSVRILTWEDKYHKSPVEARKICPAALGAGLAERIRKISLHTFRAVHCRDYGRVDLRIDRHGQPWVLEINSMASLGAGGSYVLAAAAAGYTFEALVNRILDVAHIRYFAGAAVPSAEQALCPLA